MSDRDAILSKIINNNDQIRKNNYSNLSIIPNTESKLKFSIIKDFKDPNNNNKDNLDLINVYKDSKVITKWMYHNNGCSNGNLFSGNWEYLPENDKYKIKDRKQYYNITSNQPNVYLSYPFIWTGKENDKPISCGINYIPPNNSIMLTSITDTGEVVGLGYVPSNPTVIYPILKPGEISISGYGNNFIHWGQSDKISIYCFSNEDEYDRDDNDFILNKNNCKKNATSCELEININANDRFIEIIAEESCKNFNNKNYSKLNAHPKELTEYQKTTMIITPTDLMIESTNNETTTTYTQNSDTIIKKVEDSKNITIEKIMSDKVTIDTTKYIVNANEIEINSKKDINIISDNNIKINSQNNTTIHSDDKININVPIVHPSPHPGKSLSINISGCHLNGSDSSGSVF